MAKANGGFPESASGEAPPEWEPEGSLTLSGRVIGRTAREIRVQEAAHTVYTYKVLAGSNIFWLEVWDGKPIIIGAPIKKEVEVRAYAGKGGVSYRLVIPKEEPTC
jgi:hypothetical protein